VSSPEVHFNMSVKNQTRTRRRKRARSDSDLSDTSDGDYSPHKGWLHYRLSLLYVLIPQQKTAKRSKAQQPLVKATITILATDTSPDKVDVRDRSRCHINMFNLQVRLMTIPWTVDKIDIAVIGRIKKALALASHETTGEDEARAALRYFLRSHSRLRY